MSRQALDRVSVPSYVLDRSGVVRWINPAAERLLGDVRGKHFVSVVAPEERTRAGELFARKILDASSATDTHRRAGVDDREAPPSRDQLGSASGRRRVVGVFGLLDGPISDEPATHDHALTPRQAQILRLLEQGRSTKQIAQELHLSIETVPQPHTQHPARIGRAFPARSRRPRSQGAAIVMRHARQLAMSQQRWGVLPMSVGHGRG